MVTVAWAPEALGQLADIHSYVERFDAAAADRLVQRLETAGNSLDRLPNRGRPVVGGLRELVTVPPYVIRYEVHDSGVTVLSVRHTRRQSIGR